MKKKLILTIHGAGFREPGWTTDFQEAFSTFFSDSENGGYSLRHERYGYVMQLLLLIPSIRRRLVNVLVKDLVKIAGEYDEINVIAHSLGTYLILGCLEHTDGIRLNTVIFAGSVVRKDYNFSAVRCEFKQIVNYHSRNDFIQFVAFIFTFGVFGLAGYSGFDLHDNSDNCYKVRNIAGRWGHHGYFPMLFKEWLSTIIKKGSVNDSAS